MKIVVIGGAGLIGTKVVKNLHAQGHEVVAASRSSGINAVTGEGLAEAFTGAQVVVDVSNTPSLEDQAALDFFQNAGRQIAAAAKTAGVQHLVALSIVGTDRMLVSGYFQGKMAQEESVKSSQVPYTIVRATQFFEFLGLIAAGTTVGDTVRLSDVLMQPISADDVAATITEIALATPRNSTVDLAGPDKIRLDAWARQHFAAHGDPRTVVTDPSTGYVGLPVNDQSLVPGSIAIIGPTHLADWLKSSGKHA